MIIQVKEGVVRVAMEGGLSLGMLKRMITSNSTERIVGTMTMSGTSSHSNGNNGTSTSYN